MLTRKNVGRNGSQLLDRQFHLRALLQRGLGHRPAELLGRRLQLGDVLRTRAAAARDGRWDQVIGDPQLLRSGKSLQKMDDQWGTPMDWKPHEERSNQKGEHQKHGFFNAAFEWKTGNTSLELNTLVYIDGYFTLWLFNIAMENGPFIDGLPIKNGDFPWCSMAMLNNQMVFVFFWLPGSQLQGRSEYKWLDTKRASEMATDDVGMYGELWQTCQLSFFQAALVPSGPWYCPCWESWGLHRGRAPFLLGPSSDPSWCERCGLGVWDLRSFVLFIPCGGHGFRAILTGKIHGQELGPEKSGDSGALAQRHGRSRQGRPRLAFHVQSSGALSRRCSSMVQRTMALQTTTLGVPATLAPQWAEHFDPGFPSGAATPGWLPHKSLGALWSIFRLAAAFCSTTSPGRPLLQLDFSGGLARSPSAAATAANHRVLATCHSISRLVGQQWLRRDRKLSTSD